MSPSGSDIRPTGDRVRESMFNALHSRSALVDATVLDLFAGTGALGIEALSRGARHVVFVDVSRTATTLVSENLAACDLDGSARVVRADGPAWVAASDDRWDLVLLDPPYDFDGWKDLLSNLAGRVDGPVVVESDSEVEPGPDWHVESCRRYGSTVVTLLLTGAEAVPAVDRPTIHRGETRL
jgi:16S rRNA (guanine966-N2)-methyltransferase